jgi:putative FmdB family regulatory protein
MPTYEYHCEKCKKDFDLFQSMKDDPVKTCPKEQCRQKTWGKGKVRRLLGTGAGLIFKGSGFYITDYRSEGYKAAASSDKAAAKTDASSASGASKPAESKSDSGSKTDSAPKPTPSKSTPSAEPRKPKKKE